MSNGPRKPSYNVDLIAEDMALKGWNATALAKATRVKRGGHMEPLSDMTVSRFLRKEVQTAPVASAIARALGRSVRRYLIRSEEAIAS